MQDLLKRVHAENIPDMIQGGKLREDCIPYVFEIEPGGSLSNLNDVKNGSIPQIGEEILLKNDIDNVPPIPGVHFTSQLPKGPNASQISEEIENS